MLKNNLDFNPRVEYFLNVWGYWEALFQQGISYLPSFSGMLASDDVMPDFSTKVYGSKTPYINELADRMNFVIRTRLAKDNPKAVEALGIRYIYPKAMMQKVLHKKHMSERTFFYRLSAGKKWLSHWVEEDQFFESYL